MAGELQSKIVFAQYDKNWLEKNLKKLDQYHADGVVPSSAIELAKNSKIWKRFEKENRQGEQKMNEGWEV